MNNKSIFVVLVISGLILSSLITRNGKLLLLGIPFLTYLITAVIQAPVNMRLTAKRIIEKPGVIVQEPIKTDIVICNEGNPLTNLWLSDEALPSSMTVLDGQPWQRIALSAGETVELNYVFTAQRGVYLWKSIHAVASDPFGLFEIKREIPASGEVVVRPASMNLDHNPLKPQRTLHAPGPIPTPLSGSSTDFLGIREYKSGDSLRRLNWRLAARHPHELFTNEYEREEIGDFGLILDARKLSNADGVQDTLFENSIQATLSLAEIFLKGGNRVSLLIFGETMASLFPGYGKKQLNRIVWSLARAKLGPNLSFEHLEYFPTRLFPSRSMLVVISPVGAHDDETYARLRSFGYDIVLISPDPIDSIHQLLPQTEVNQLAVRTARVERILQLKRLLKLGIQVIDWQVNQPFELVLQSIDTHRQRRNLQGH